MQTESRSSGFPDMHAQTIGGFQLLLVCEKSAKTCSVFTTEKGSVLGVKQSIDLKRWLF